jgi:hypothetical protein
MPFIVTAEGDTANSGTYRGEFSTRAKAIAKALLLRKDGSLVRVMDTNGFYIAIDDKPET